MSRMLRIAVWAITSLVAVTEAATASTTTSSTNGLVQMPLIPHHVQHQRKLQELQEQGNLEGIRRLQESMEQPRPSQRHRHQLRHRRTEVVEVGALYHGYGTHYVDVWVGTPPQRQTVIVDTGSGTTAFPCSGCSHCGAPTYHIDAYFEQDQSSTFQKVACDACQRGTCHPSALASAEDEQCKINMSYAEGSSWYAFEAIDMTYLGGPHTVALQGPMGGTDPVDPILASQYSFLMNFGCQYRLTGLFEKQLADGIMGMENAKTAFWKQMYNAGKLGNDQQFSLCFSRPPQAKRDGTEAGALTLGGTDPRLHLHDMVYTDHGQGRSGFFGVYVKAVYLRDGSGGESALSADPTATTVNLNIPEADLNRGGVIVDSGTTDTYWTRPISTAFRAAFQELSGFAFSNKPMHLSAAEVAKLPTLLFQLSGDVARNQALYPDPSQVAGLAAIDPNNPYDVILALPPSHYMEQDSSGSFTARFYDTEGSGSVLGANSMMGHDILFDVDTMTLGWAESACDYEELVTSAGFTSVLAPADQQPQGGGVATPEEPAAEPEPAVPAVEDEVPSEPAVEPEEPVAETKAPTEPEPATPPLTPEVIPEEEEQVEVLPEEPELPDTSSQEVEKKDHPIAGEDAHDGESPMDDIVKAANGLVDACNSFGCRGGVAVTILLLVGLACVCGRCLCRPKRHTRKPKHYHRAEVELSNGSYSDSGFMDEPDDAEFGEFS